MKNKYLLKTLAIVLTGALCGTCLSACGKKDEEKKAAPSDIVATVNGDEIQAGVLAMSARYQQIQTEMIYQAYFGSSAAGMWDMAMDEESGETYGQQTVNSSLEELEKMYLLRAHAEEYGVTLTDEQKQQIEDAAASFAEANGEEVLAKMLTDQSSVQEYLELYAYQELMRAPIVADVDKEVSNEEAQQTTVTYVTITKPEVPAEEEAEVAAEEETGESEEEAAEETTEEAVEEAKSVEELQKIAEEILEAMTKDTEQDMTEVAHGVYEEAQVQTESFSANVEDEYSNVPEEVKAAVAELKDGEMAKEVIDTDEAFYVVRLDAVFDADETEMKKESIISQREDDLYAEVTDGWVSAAEIEVKDDVKNGITVNSREIFVEKASEQETEENAEEFEFEDVESEDMELEGTEGEEIDESELEELEDAEYIEDMEEDLDTAEEAEEDLDTAEEDKEKTK